MSSSTSPNRLESRPPSVTSSLWENRKCLAICCLVSMANLEFGMDSGVIGTLQAMPGFLMVFGYPNKFIPGGYGLNSTFQQLITSLPILGSLISCLIAGPLSTFFGRRTSLLLACVFTLVGVAIQMNPTDSKAAIYIGRVILGMGNGFLQTFSNIYCAEVSPAHLRGIMVALSSEWLLIGSILAAVITNATVGWMDMNSYIVPLGVLLVLPVVLGGVLLWPGLVPETPRWLIVQGRNEDARKALGTLRGEQTLMEEVGSEFIEMVKGIEEEKRIAGRVTMGDMFKGTDRRRTLLCIGVSVADAGGSGAWYLIPYVMYFMAISGVPSADIFHYFLINTCLGLVACNLSMFCMRHVCGRRTLLMIGSVLNAAFMLGLAVSATVPTSPDTARTCMIVFVSLFLVSYSFATGVVTRPVATEMVSTRLRAYSYGMSTAVSQVIVWLVSFCTPYFINPEKMHWGGKYGYIWVGSNVICLVWYYLFVPEMKGRSLEEIDELFEKKVAARDFKAFVSGIHDDGLRDVRGRNAEGYGGKRNVGVDVQETLNNTV